jgi:hypothetical protein
VSCIDVSCSGNTLGRGTSIILHLKEDATVRLVEMQSNLTSVWFAGVPERAEAGDAGGEVLTVHQLPHLPVDKQGGGR